MTGWEEDEGTEAIEDENWEPDGIDCASCAQDPDRPWCGYKACPGWSEEEIRAALEYDEYIII